MRIPSPMVELNESPPPLGQSPRHHTIVGKTGLARLRSVFREDARGLLAGGRGGPFLPLHAERHFILGDARDGLRISERGISLPIDLVNRVQHSAAQGTAYSRRIVQIQHRFSMGAALDALVNTRKEAGTPQLFAAVRRFTSRQQHDKSRQILILRAQSVDYPGTE